MILTFPTIRRKHPWLIRLLVAPARIWAAWGFFSLIMIPYLPLRLAGNHTSLPRWQGWISFGEVQQVQRLYRGGFGPFEWVCWLFYVSFFFSPLIILGYLGAADVRQFFRVAVTVAALYYVAGFFFLLMPTEPPWMHGATRILQARRTVPLGLDPNPAAAFPSLHVGEPFLFALLVKRLRPLLLIQTAGVAFAVVYLGEHYVLDVLAGMTLAYAVYRLSGYIDERLRPHFGMSASM